jgi:tetratricopeptide (TPR) repeat protein
MANLLAQSQEWIEAGAGRMLDAGAEVNENLAAASCAMAQICLEKEMPAKAVEWLDHPKIGAHTLLSHPVTDQAGFRIDTLKLTLRAYIAAQRWNDFGPTLAALEEMGKGIALVPVYMSLGRQLEESLKQYEELHDTTQADQAAAILDSVLTRIFNRADAEVDFDCLNWTAEAFYHLGSRLDRGVKPGAEAVALYKKAGNVYGRILTMAAADPKFAPNPSAITDIEIARARCHRRLGEFNAAIAILVKILRSQNFLIAAQREAAYVYQGWGEERANNFLSAIRGANQIELNNKSTFTIVWGWGMISKRAMAGKGNEALYFEARYNMAFCRFRYAQTKANPERTALLRKAEQDILVVLRPYPEMGGKAWYDQFDQLLKRIQNALGDKEDGLKGANERILKELEKAAEPPADQSDQNQ